MVYNDINKNSKDNRAETKCYKNIKYLNMANLLSIKKLINNKRNSWINSIIDCNKVSKKK